MISSDFGKEYYYPDPKNPLFVVSSVGNEYQFEFPKNTSANFKILSDDVHKSSPINPKLTIIQASALVAFRTYGKEKWPETFTGGS